MIKKGSLVKSVKKSKDGIYKSYVVDVITINSITYYKVAASNKNWRRDELILIRE